jgi:hypothetical protein
MNLQMHGRVALGREGGRGEGERQGSMGLVRRHGAFLAVERPWTTLEATRGRL